MAGEFDDYLQAAGALPTSERDIIARILLDPTGQLAAAAYGNLGLQYSGLVGAANQLGRADPNYWAGTALGMPAGPPPGNAPYSPPAGGGPASDQYAAMPFDAAAMGEFRNLLDRVN